MQFGRREDDRGVRRQGLPRTDTPGLTKAVTDALASGKPALINAVIDPTASTESGHIQSVNPKSAAAQKK